MAAGAERKSGVGRSALSLPGFGFGGAHLGELFETLPERQAEAALEAAWDGGVRYFDTAPWYGHGLSEHRIGRLLQKKPRDRFALSTKVGRVYHPPADPAAYSTAPWAGGLPFGVPYEPAMVAPVVEDFDGLLTLGGRYAMPAEWYVGPAAPAK